MEYGPDVMSWWPCECWVRRWIACPRPGNTRIGWDYQISRTATLRERWVTRILDAANPGWSLRTKWIWYSRMCNDGLALATVTATSMNVQAKMRAWISGNVSVNERLNKDEHHDAPCSPLAPRVALSPISLLGLSASPFRLSLEEALEVSLRCG